MPVNTLNESVLRRLTRLDSLQFYCMFFCPFSQRQRDKSRSIIHAKHGRLAAVFRDPVEDTPPSAGRVDLDRSTWTVFSGDLLFCEAI